MSVKAMHIIQTAAFLIAVYFLVCVVIACVGWWRCRKDPWEAMQVPFISGLLGIFSAPLSLPIYLFHWLLHREEIDEALKLVERESMKALDDLGNNIPRAPSKEQGAAGTIHYLSEGEIDISFEFSMAPSCSKKKGGVLVRQMRKEDNGDESDAAFWVQDGKVYAANEDAAKQVPHLPRTPASVSEKVRG